MRQFRPISLLVAAVLTLAGFVVYRMTNRNAPSVVSRSAQVSTPPATRTDTTNNHPPSPRAPESERARLERIRRYGYISRERLELVRPILKDYHELEQKLWVEYQGRRTIRPDGPLHRAINVLARERLADLRKVLTPPEAEDIDLRLTFRAAHLLDSLQVVRPTAEEERTLLRLNQEIVQEHGRFGSFSIAETPGRYRAELAMYERMRAELGSERFETFLAQHDDIYWRFSSIVRRQNLPPEVAFELWRLKSDFTIRRSEITMRQLEAASNPDAWEQYLAARDAVAHDAKVKVAALVGEAAVRENEFAFKWLSKPTSNGTTASSAKP